jgi:uncharacterized protein YciI
MTDNLQELNKKTKWLFDKSYNLINRFLKMTVLNKILIFSVVIALVSACGPGTVKTSSVTTPASPDSTGYDSLLAARLGADRIGMSRYVMAFLKKGPNRPTDSLARVELQKGHMANIERMAKEGKLVLAGPFTDDGDLRGIYVFNVETVEEARALTESDPAVKAGSLVMELHTWYGSAALKQVSEIHERLRK